MAIFKQRNTLSDIRENWKETNLYIVLFCFGFRLCGNFFLSTLVFLFQYPSTTTPFSSSELLLTQGQTVAHEVNTVGFRGLFEVCLKSLSKLRGVSSMYVTAKFTVTVSGNGRNTPCTVLIYHGITLLEELSTATTKN